MTDTRGAVHLGATQPQVVPGNWSNLAMTPRGSIFAADELEALMRAGAIFIASDGDENDLAAAAATSFAATTPTLLLDVPSGTICRPLYVCLQQGGTVGGDFVQVSISVETAKVRYSSGGTAETNIIGARSDKPVSPLCTLYSNPTAAAAGTAAAIYHQRLAEDVDPASADAADFEFGNNGVWTPPVPLWLKGPASFLVFTYAGTTGPQFLWSLGWAEYLTANER